MILEVIATTIDDIAVASASAADRIELVSGIAEGGLTPSIGLIEAAVATSKIPVYVMIRPHSQSFTYSEADITLMIRDIEAVKACGAPGIVIGSNNSNRQIDIQSLERLLKAADGLDVTYHRAFDELVDQFEGLKVLAQYPAISRILTSGGADKAIDSMEHLKRLQQRAVELGLHLQGGSGLSVENTEQFLRETGIGQVHYGSAVRVDSSFSKPMDPNRIYAIRQILKPFE